MHSKLKGNIAQSSIILALQKEGLNVFTEVGDFSRIDLIVEKNSILKKVQVKYSGTRAGNVSFRLDKSGPNGYRYSYTSKDVDWFAIFDPESEKIAWVKASDICDSSQGSMTIRTQPSKNNQSKKIRLIDDYSIDKFLKDFGSK